MTTPIIRLDNVSKRFSKNQIGKRRIVREQVLRDLFGLQLKQQPALREGEFWGLNQVSLNIAAGESIGLIGPNGAGKSTLIKMIAGMLTPDIGTCDVSVPISKLISLSAEFQQDLSGRENVFLVGAVRGMGFNVIRRKFDEIVAFAELEEFIDAPFHTYSQGMRLRLAFAVAVHSHSPVMLIDEVLAVGDIKFRQKCLRRLTEMKRETTYVMASHSYGYISQFCERSLVVESGHIIFDGPTRGAIAFAEDRSVVDNDASTVGTAQEMRIGQLQIDEAIGDVSAGWVNNRGEPIKNVDLGVPLHFRTSFTLKRPIADILNIHIQVSGLESQTLLSFSNRSSGKVITADPGRPVSFTADLGGVSLQPGRHGCAISIFDGVELIYRANLPALVVDGKGHRIWGEVQIKPNWRETKAVHLAE